MSSFVYSLERRGVAEMFKNSPNGRSWDSNPGLSASPRALYDTALLICATFCLLQDAFRLCDFAEVLYLLQPWKADTNTVSKMK